MSSNPSYIGNDYRVISGEFRYKVEKRNQELLFRWDQAAIGKDGSINLVEKELSKPTPLHIHGHIARAAYMDSVENSVQKLIWIVRRENFSRLWNIVEPWRISLADKMGWIAPPCEYWSPDEICLGSSIRRKSNESLLSEDKIHG